MGEPKRLDSELLAAYRAGDEEAAEVLFERYYLRLLELIRGERGVKRDRLEGTSDVAQSVLRSFFRRGLDGQITISDQSSLWPYLATITLNKVRNRVRFWNRQRRDQGRNVPLESRPDPLEAGPSAEEANIIKEIVSELLAAFSPRRQKILEMLLDGHAPTEIATVARSSVRTVYQTRDAARDVLAHLLGAEIDVDPGPPGAT